MTALASPGLSSHPGITDLFHFHPRSTNPELWRTSLPLVVRERCKRHKGLVATWTAIHWLIVLHAASGRAHFGMREIAEEAGVGRNELAGPTGHIQRLVELGLVRIVGYRTFKGLREPRPVYHVDLAELERLSLDLVPDVLREHQIDRPPPSAPDPRQLHMALVPTDEPLAQPLLSHPSHPGGTTRDLPTRSSGGGPHEDGTAEYLMRWPAPSSTPESVRPTHPNGTGSEVSGPHSGGVTHPNGTGAHGNRPYSPSERRSAPDPTQASHHNGTEPARKQDMDGGNERTNEGASHALTPDLLQSLVTQATQAVLATLQAQGSPTHHDAPPALSATPPPPHGAEPLSASVLTLWQGDQTTVRRRDAHQLALLAAEYDGPTGGHGAYWLGRAILMADLCLGDREQPITVAYVRRILRRWREEGSWGSDREVAEATPRGASEPVTRRPAAAGSPPDEAQRHPAVAAYIEALHETPNAVQAAQIAGTVSNLGIWRQVLTDWQLNGWGERSVGKMLDRYQKGIPGAAAATEPPPSVAVIHTYPGLTPEQRERWIRKFHAAATPAEKRAVLGRLEQEHPR